MDIIVAIFDCCVHFFDISTGFPDAKALFMAASERDSFADAFGLPIMVFASQSEDDVIRKPARLVLENLQ